MTMTFRSTRTIAVGEAMIEMAVVGDNTYRRNFAGDTFNTLWHMAQTLPDAATCGFLTAVGSDKVSDDFVRMMSDDGLDVACVGRVEDRTIGLYLIDLDGVERSFQYWRSQSAARLLADDVDLMDAALGEAGLIHLSGITLAILSPDARARLFDALVRARAAGARLSLDPNYRPRLWASEDEARDALARFAGIADIALPSFDDEHALWGDSAIGDTIRRFAGAGVAEVVVKNGAGPVTVWDRSADVAFDTPPVSEVRDTAGAGDAFNAGYLSGRLLGFDAGAAVAHGQAMSAEVLRHFGARIPKGQVPLA